MKNETVLPINPSLGGTGDSKLDLGWPPISSAPPTCPQKSTFWTRHPKPRLESQFCHPTCCKTWRKSLKFPKISCLSVKWKFVYVPSSQEYCGVQIRGIKSTQETSNTTWVSGSIAVCPLGVPAHGEGFLPSRNTDDVKELKSVCAQSAKYRDQTGRKWMREIPAFSIPQGRRLIHKRMKETMNE